MKFGLFIFLVTFTQNGFSADMDACLKDSKFPLSAKHGREGAIIQGPVPFNINADGTVSDLRGILSS
jgi:hypothetical protein